MNKNLHLLIILCFVFLFSGNSSGQMFSVGEAPPQNTFPNSFFRIGYGPTSFIYTGTNTDPFGPSSLEFDNNALFLNFETPSTSLSLTLARKLTGLEDQTYFDLGFTLSNKFAFVRRRFITAGIPIQLYSSLTNVNHGSTEEDFNQVNFAIGGGAFINLRLSNRIFFTNEFTPGYGFSNSSGGFFGGSMFYMTGKTRLNFGGLIGGNGLSIGYDFNYRSFDIDDEFYDFDLKSHLITIGISL